VIEVLDPRELTLPNVGTINVVDPRTGRRRSVATQQEKVRTAFAVAAAEQRDNNAAQIVRAGADHLVLRTDRDWLFDVVRFVGARRRRIAAGASR